MILLRRILVGLVALAFTGATRAELQLFCEFAGQTLPIADVDRHHAYAIVDGKKIKVPRDARWKLDGDLAANATVVDWSPDYTVGRTEALEGSESAESAPFTARVTVTHATEMMGKKQESEFLKNYPGGIPRAALGVLGWMRGGQILHVTARPMPGTKEVKFHSLSHAFGLSESEATGQAVALLWMDGAFVPVAPRFDRPVDQAAFVAAMLDDQARLREALQAGAKPNATAKSGASLLHFAVEAGHVETIDQLATAGKVNPNRRTSKMPPPLLWAVRTGRTAAVEKLLALGASAKVSHDDKYPLHEAIRNGYETLALRLVEAGATGEARDHLLQAPVVLAIDQGMAELTRKLIARGSKIDFKDDQTARVLITQARKSHVAMVAYLLEQKVKPDLETRGQTALISGAHKGDPEIARLLLAAGASAGHAATDGLTALMIAAANNRSNYAAVLLDAGAPVDAALRDGVQALHLAAAGRSEECARLLLDRGAPAEVRDSSGRSPVELALAARVGGIANALAAYGAKLDLARPSFAEYLEAAIVLDCAGLVKKAMADGWSPTTPLSSGWTARRIAEICGSADCAKVLATAGVGATEEPPVVGASELDAQPQVMRAVVPIDPRDIDANHPSADVIVDVVIDPGGHVRFPRITGTPDKRLAAATLDAIHHWKFNLPRKQGQPVGVRVRIPINFPSARDRALDLSEVDVLPVVTHQALPEYPRDLLNKGRGGEVRLRFVVNPEGRTENIRVRWSSHPDLEGAAIGAVQKWRFKPGILEGKPSATRMEVPIIFSITP